jgi:transposase-like protein
MMECERCERDVEHVLRHREYGVAVTHRVSRWLCRDCHPNVPSGSPLASNATPEESSEPVVTDGGTIGACPQCSSSTVNVQGIRNCTDCGWQSHY